MKALWYNAVCPLAQCIASVTELLTDHSISRRTLRSSKSPYPKLATTKFCSSVLIYELGVCGTDQHIHHVSTLVAYPKTAPTRANRNLGRVHFQVPGAYSHWIYAPPLLRFDHSSSLDTKLLVPLSKWARTSKDLLSVTDASLMLALP